MHGQIFGFPIVILVFGSVHFRKLKLTTYGKQRSPSKHEVLKGYYLAMEYS